MSLYFLLYCPKLTFSFIESTEPYKNIVGASSIMHAYWGPLNENIYASHGNGDVSVFDAEVCVTGL